MTELVKQKFDVTVIDDFSTGKLTNVAPEIKKKLYIKNKDICKLNEQDKISQFDVIFHLAAKPYSKTQSDWLKETNEIYKTNTYGTFNLLRLSNSNCHFIFASSASVYGVGTNLIESIPYNPQSAYGYSKTIAEQTLINSQRKYTIFRPATIIGENGRCFPNRLCWSLVNNKECSLFKNGLVIRDIIDVHDVVDALIKTMQYEFNGVYNLGANKRVTGSQLFKILKKLCITEKFDNIKLTQFVPKGFVDASTLTSDKLYKRLIWTPQVTLEDSLEKIMNFYRIHPESNEPPSWDNL